MRLTEYLDKGASLGPSAPCLTADGVSLSYAQVQELSWRVARALARSGVRPGEKVAVLSGNDPLAFACVFGISRSGAVWCPVNPRNEAGENLELLAHFDCTALFVHSSFAPLVSRLRAELPALSTVVCLDGGIDGAESFAEWTAGLPDSPWQADPVDDVALLVGTGGTTGRSKGVMLTGHNIEAMTALTLMSYPFQPRPRYLALAPLTHAAGVLCFPVLALGGEVVVMRRPDLGEFCELVARHRVTHTFLPPTLIYLLLDHPALPGADLGSLECLWYGAAPMSATRLEQAIERLGPVLGQLFGQSEAPMMISTLSPAEHLLPDGSLARARFTSAGRPTPLTQVAIMAEDGTLLAPGERGEIVVRGPLVMAGYYKDPAATEEVSRHGWHHTGDIGYLDGESFLHIVDRAKDVIITGGFNVYSAEVEQALMTHPSVRDCAVVGLPHEKWGEQVTAVVELHSGGVVGGEELRAVVRERLGGVKTPKVVHVWAELPRSKVGKVLKREVRGRLL
ncbi:acyl-CoA synthetase (AMP-forming)/AMP-acid ligase II [Crossiella equi]|uniref:Acyl-CoA synthetase (AMP-forming)/AMP-acid ligase II n=1 Tax=Crossiella equi TaxID=130796 RepID=A0ABS5A7R7_9PSEU|nr:AMP-binding protein [Crossiella equi]MBP2471745.1 acyl-CoA synthetase (AMP-forming)/AMP-acid ligase II [Crossiella equi]